MFINQINPTTTNLMSFKAVDVKMLERNKTKILITATSDIYAPKLKIKKPETLVEKEVLLEILEKRKFLDKLIRLTNERFRTNVIIDEYNELVEKNPHSEECQNLKEEIDKKGDLKKYYETVDKQIAIERKKYENSLNYFAEIDQLEDEYLEHKKLKLTHIDKYYDQVEKNNLNPNKEYGTKELIEIVQAIEVDPQKIKQALNDAKSLFKKTMLENINIYQEEKIDFKNIVENAKNTAENAFSNFIKSNNDFKKEFNEFCREEEQRCKDTILSLQKIRMHVALDAFFNLLEETEEAIKILIDEIKSDKKLLKKDPKNEHLKKTIENKEDRLADAKDVWIEYLISCVNLEKENINIMKNANCSKKYEYIVENNKKVQKYREAIKVYNENDGEIPEEFWNKLL